MKKRELRVEGSVAYVQLTKGAEAVIDADDIQLVAGKNWCKHNEYAATSTKDAEGRRRLVRMHNLIAAPASGFVVDHINGNGLDNRRSNLRLATASENQCNRRAASNIASGLKGAYWDKSKGKYGAEIKVRGQRYKLGRYSTAEEAHAAYADAAAILHGEFARAS